MSLNPRQMDAFENPRGEPVAAGDQDDGDGEQEEVVVLPDPLRILDENSPEGVRVVDPVRAGNLIEEQDREESEDEHDAFE